MSDSVIKNKSFQFALAVINLYKKMIAENEYVISKQLLKSGTSIGANIEEAQAGQSKRDFIAKMAIASKEARETRYWLLLIQKSDLTKVNVESELKDIDELIRILTSIVKTAQLKK